TLRRRTSRRCRPAAVHEGRARSLCARKSAGYAGRGSSGCASRRRRSTWQNEVDATLEVLGGANKAARRLEEEGGRLPRESPGTGSDDGPHEGSQEGSARCERSDRVQVAGRGARPHRSGRTPSPSTEDALRRIHRVALRAEGDDEGDQKRSKS